MIIYFTSMTEKDKNEIFYMVIKEFTTKLEVYWHPSFLESAGESSCTKFWAWKLPLESRNWRRPRQHKCEASVLTVSIKSLSAFSRHQRKLHFLWQFWLLSLANIPQVILIKGNVSACHIWFVSKCYFSFWIKYYDWINYLSVIFI
jgi:hypothetical protein